MKPNRRKQRRLEARKLRAEPARVRKQDRYLRHLRDRVELEGYCTHGRPPGHREHRPPPRPTIVVAGTSTRVLLTVAGVVASTTW